MAFKINIFNFFIKSFEKVSSIVKKYGVLNSLTALFVCMSFVMLVKIYNSNTIDSVLTAMSAKHDMGLEQRQEANVHINKILETYVVPPFEAERSFVCEFHNGKTNLTGLPFKYFDMGYECVRNVKIMPISYEYKDVPVQFFKIVDYLYSKNCYVGNVEDLDNIDHFLTLKLKERGIKYVAIIYIKDNKNDIGLLGICFKEKPNNDTIQQLYKNIYNDSATIGQLLNFEK